MNCPLCIDQILGVTHRNGIELDICPKCRGIWLDRGEIDRLIAEDATAPPSPPAPAPASRSFRRDDDDTNDDDDDRRRSKSKKKRKKKKSLADRIGDAFEEVFDELT